MRKPKFKVGDKARIIKWLDMPQELQDSYSINIMRIGEIGIIKRVLEEEYDNTICYDVLFNGNIYPVFLLEQELESIIKVGEQLTFSFMKGV